MSFDTMTVLGSRNHYPHLTEEMRSKVTQAIRVELGFKPMQSTSVTTVLHHVTFVLIFLDAK